VETQARLFGGLYRLFADRRLVVFPHDQLRREALNLVTKTVGGRLKVVDSAAIHQDHVIALGGAADVLMTAQVRTFRPWIAPVGVSGGWSSGRDRGIVMPGLGALGLSTRGGF
jgi:hypothetical protein